jgi:hypothetical protein
MLARKNLQRVLERKKVGDRGITDEKYDTAKLYLEQQEHRHNSMAIVVCD